MRLANATRIAVGLTLLTVCVVSGALALGLLEGSRNAASRVQMRTAEVLAVQLSSAITTGDGKLDRNVIERLMQATPGINSLGLRRSDGKLLAASPEHATRWSDRQQDGTGHTIEVPLFLGQTQWGTLEMLSENAVAPSVWSDWPALAFVGGMGGLAYLLYMRRTLRILDPSTVVPERVKAMLDTLAEGAVIIDLKCQLVLANASFAAMFDLPAERLIGTQIQTLPWIAGAKPWESALKGETSRAVSLQIRHPDGTIRTLMANASAVHGARQDVRGALLTLDDITPIEQKNTQLTETVRQLNEAQERVNKQNEELQRLATRDMLTGCLNRRAFHEQLSLLYGLSQRHATALSAIMVDVDHFKNVNDTHGHARGDEVLRGVAERLQQSVRTTDVVCRYGGEEFCILLPHTPLKDAFQVALKIREAFHVGPIADLNVTASMGVSSLSIAPNGAQQMIEQADEALYASKRGGRDRATRFDHVDPLLKVSARSAKVPSNISIEAVRALVAALGFRDAATAEHSLRVAQLCVRTGQGWLTERELWNLEVAAQLHDIGKVGVPDAILLKPGPLTDDEWDVMGKHDQIGAQIVAASFTDADVNAIISHHHRYYRDENALLEPARLRAPLCGRLLSIVDALDAMTHDRVYRDAISIQDAFAELRRCSGTQFDTYLVEHVINVLTASAADVVMPGPEIRLTMQLDRIVSSLEARDVARARELSAELCAGSAELGDAAFLSTAKRLSDSLVGTFELSATIRLVDTLLDRLIAELPERPADGRQVA
jgi:diguanylate cyclase (GGDEF)-like protein/PAS domain S-box-containing protein